MHHEDTYYREDTYYSGSLTHIMAAATIVLLALGALQRRLLPRVVMANADRTPRVVMAKADRAAPLLVRAERQRPGTTRAEHRPYPFVLDEEIELTIDGLTNHGDGVGRLLLPQDDTRWVVMVPFALPGERVRAAITANLARHSQARLVAVLTPAPHRRQPACELFGVCGGCQYQHLAYSEQLAWKTEQVHVYT